MKIFYFSFVFAALMAPSLVTGKANIDPGCDDVACPIPAPHPPHVRRAAKPAVTPAVGREQVPTRDFDAGCDDPACPIPQPHPPHHRRAVAPAVGREQVPTRDFDAGCDDPACPNPQPHPPHHRRAAAPAEKVALA